MYDQTLHSHKDVMFFPLGLIINANEKCIDEAYLITVYGNRVVKWTIKRTVKIENSPYQEYGYSGHQHVQYMLEDKQEAYNLLNEENEENIIHYKFSTPMLLQNAYDVFSNVMQSLEDNLAEPPKEFTFCEKWYTDVVNIMVNNSAESGRDQNYLKSTHKDYISVHPEDLDKAVIVLKTQQRKFKIWRSQ